MLGPLPPLHRWIVCSLVLLVCVGLGAWLAWTLPIPLVAPMGACVGAALGVLRMVLLVHDGSPRARDRSRRTP